MKEFLPFVALVIAACSLILNLFQIWRNGNWRNSDEGQKLIARVVAVEQSPDWHDTEAGRRLVGRVSDVENQLSAGEERFKSLATKADVARLEADVDNLKHSIGGVDAGVTRIEMFLMNGGGK